MQAIIRFECLPRRGGVDPIIRMRNDGNIYTFEKSDKVESQLTRLLAGCRDGVVVIPADIVRRSNKCPD